MARPLSRRRLLAVTASLTLSAAACTSDGQQLADQVASVALDSTGEATLDGDDIVVSTESGPLRLTPAEDTEFFICDGDDCSAVEESTFREAVTPGSTIRVLGPNADLLTPEMTELPPAVWVVLQR